MTKLYYGQDPYLLSEHVKELVVSAKKDGVQIEKLDAGEAGDQEFLLGLREALESQGLFSQKKLVFVYDLLSEIKKYPKTEEFLADYIKKQNDSDLVFVEREGFDKRLKFYKQLQKTAETREFATPAGGELERWAEKYLEENGREIEKAALKKFVSLLAGGSQEVIYNMWQVKNELDKLALFADDGREIALGDVLAVTPVNIDQNVFTLTNLFGEGKGAEAARLMEKMIGAGGPSDVRSRSVQIIGALASQIHSLLLVKHLSGLSPSEIAEKLAWKPGRVWINQKLAGKFDLSVLRRMVSDLAAIDLRLKTSDESPKLLLTLFFQKTGSR